MQKKQQGDEAQPDADLLEALTSGRRSHPNRCVIGVLLDGVTPEQRSAIERALADESIGANTICTVLRDHNLGNVHHSALGRHRKGQCRCV